MSKVKVAAFSISIDGFGAGPRQDLQNPLGVRGLELHSWFFPTDTFKKMHGQSGGSTGVDNDVAAESFENVGAWILGRNMFGPVRGPWKDDSWKGWWGENPPYHTPVFVLTHHARPALAIAMLGAIESLLSAVIADAMTGKKHDPNAELVALGIGNIVTPFFGGIAATGALARTATNIRAGAVSLTADGRKTVIRAWERRMGAEVRHPKFGYEVTYRRAVEVQARILAAHLLGELPSYEPLVTR